MKNYILRPIPGHRGYYASVDGLIFSNRSGSFTLLKQGLNTLHGRYQVHLGGKTYSVQRLIAKTWIPNPKNKPCVCHKNNIRTDNRVSNLYWGTYLENAQQCIRDNRFRPRGKVPISSNNKASLVCDYLSGMTLSELRTKYSLGNTRITGILKESNVQRVNGNHRLIYSGRIQRALRDYQNSSLTTREICAKYKLGHTSLGNYLKKYQIPRRRKSRS